MSAQAKEKWSLNARCNQKRAPSALPVSRVPEVVKTNPSSPKPLKPLSQSIQGPQALRLRYGDQILKLLIMDSISLVIYFRVDFYI